MACRNIDKGELVRQQLLEHKAEAVVFVVELDLNSLASIKRFADYIESNFEEVFALVNNAGIFYYPQELTEDGFDVTLQTNYIGMTPITCVCLLSQIIRS